MQNAGQGFVLHRLSNFCGLVFLLIYYYYYGCCCWYHACLNLCVFPGGILGLRVFLIAVLPWLAIFTNPWRNTTILLRQVLDSLIELFMYSHRQKLILCAEVHVELVLLCQSSRGQFGWRLFCCVIPVEDSLGEDCSVVSVQ